MIHKLLVILQLHSIQILINSLLRKKYIKKPFSALEVFGSIGKKITYYANKTSKLEIWEIDPDCKQILQHNFPNATIKITDSFKEVKGAPTQYDVIVIDNSMSVYGSDNEFCEHFGLFPDIFKWSKSGTVFIINVLTKKTELTQKKYPYLFNSNHNKFRSEFYGTNQPENLNFETLSNTYKNLAAENNQQIAWAKIMKYNFFWKKDIVSYFVFQMQ